MTERAGKKAPGGKRGERAPTSNFTMRLKPSLLAELKQSAAAREHSIAAEAERRLSHPEVNEIGRLVALAVDAAESRAGNSWGSDPDVKASCRAAADAVLTLLLGAPIDEGELIARLRIEIERARTYALGGGILDRITGTEPIPPAPRNEIERGLDLADALLEARRAAGEIVPAEDAA